MICADALVERSGDSWTLHIEPDADGPALSLANATLNLMVKAHPDDLDADAKIDYSAVLPDTVDTQAGKGAITVPPSLTRLIEGTYYVSLRRLTGVAPNIEVVTLIPDLSRDYAELTVKPALTYAGA